MRARRACDAGTSGWPCRRSADARQLGRRTATHALTDFCGRRAQQTQGALELRGLQTGRWNRTADSSDGLSIAPTHGHRDAPQAARVFLVVGSVTALPHFGEHGLERLHVADGRGCKARQACFRVELVDLSVAEL